MSAPETAPCDLLTPFLDGEIAPTDAQVFREHLRWCQACQDGVITGLQLSTRLAELKNG